jgi:hypothetical protein
VGLRKLEQDTEVLRLTSKTSASVVAADGSQLNTTLLVGLGLSSSKSVNSTSVALKLFAPCQFGIRTGILQLQPHVDVDNIFYDFVEICKADKIDQCAFITISGP